MLTLDRKRDILNKYLYNRLGEYGIYFNLRPFHSGYKIHIYLNLPNRSKHENMENSAIFREKLKQILCIDFDIKEKNIDCKYQNSMQKGIGFTYYIMISRNKLSKVLALCKISN